MPNHFRQSTAKLFTEILKEITDGSIHLQPHDTIGKAFEKGLMPLDFELTLYSLEATTGARLSSKFYKGSIKKNLGKTVTQFLGDYLMVPKRSDPLFVTKTFKKFAQSCKWEFEGLNEPGPN